LTDKELLPFILALEDLLRLNRGGEMRPLYLKKFIVVYNVEDDPYTKDVSLKGELLYLGHTMLL